MHSICLLTFTLLMNLLFLGSYSLVAITRFTVFAMGMVAGDWYLTDPYWTGMLFPYCGYCKFLSAAMDG